MAYTVLARKYRPQSFAELVGQEHVARTLRHAIEQDRVAHAFLFTGVRGVGKTTTARLLAKALNCEQGPAPEPCNACDPCREIAEGSDMDVLEIDGASHNRVEDVRQLQEQLPYRPARDRFKIVIVDEVHMLSTGAFNALLKTLEEPPPHVKFIFATTEAHKVPITIRSRCQRYDFRLIPRHVVAERVRGILEREGIEADEAAVSLVAQEAAGSMRDALTLLDQLVAFAGERLEGEAIARALGIADRAQLDAAVRALLAHDPRGALRAVAAFAERGADMLQTAQRLLRRLRDLVVLSVAGDADDLVEMTADERREAREMLERVEPVELQRLFRGLTQLVDEVGRAGSPRMALEMGLVRLATQPALQDFSALLGRLERLERQLAAGGGPRPARGVDVGPAGAAQGARAGSAGSPRRGRQREQGGRAASEPEPDGAGGGTAAAPAEGGGRKTRRRASSEPQEPVRRASERALPEAPGFEGADGSAAGAGVGPTGDAPARAGEVEVVEDPAGEPPPLPEHWERFVEAVARRQAALGAMLEHVEPEVSEEELGLRVPAAMREAIAADGEDVALLERVAAEVFGRPLRVSTRAARQAERTLARRHRLERAWRAHRLRLEALEHPSVQLVREVFSAGEPKIVVVEAS